jgi:Ca2+-binding EF-hand superfamily protein
VDLPNESKRNGKAVSKYRRTKNQPTNPINRETIAKLYDITPYEMTKLKKLFEIHSGVDRKLNFQEFVRLYGYMNENLRGPHIITLAERAFQFSDTNNDGLINFDEFLVSYALSKPYANLPPPLDQEKLQAQQIPISLQANPLGVPNVAQNLIPSRSYKIVPQYIPQLLEPNASHEFVY